MRTWQRYVLYAIALLLTSVIPLALAERESKLFYEWSSFGPEYRIYEIWGLTASVVLVLLTVWEVRARKPRSINEFIQILMPVVLAYGLLSIFCNYSRIEYDWLVFSTTADEFMDGGSPYRLEQFPLPYPPTSVLLISQWHGLLTWLSDLFYAEPPHPDRIWGYLYFWQQTAQWMGIICAYFLLSALGRRFGLAPHISALLCGALLIANNPIVREYKFGQPNIWVLDLYLIALLYAERNRYLAGFAAALGGHLKLYPLSIFWAWLIKRKWMQILITILGMVGIFWYEVWRGHAWLWMEVWKFWTETMRSPLHFRNNNLHGLIENTFGIIAPDLHPARNYFWVAFLILIFIWFVIRAVHREKNGGDIYGHAADGLALALLFTPDAWSHTYVFAIPIVLYSIAKFWNRHPWAVGIASLMMLAFTTSDIYPLSYHRIFGLIILMIATHPVNSSALIGNKDQKDDL